MARRAAAIALLAASLSACRAAREPSRGDHLAICGRDEIFIVDPANPGRKLWSWRPASRREIPLTLRPRFVDLDECKPLEGGARFLVTASGGAAAVVERSSGRATWWAPVVNAHSAELVPGDRVAVAASDGEGGDRVVLFDLAAPGQQTSHDELASAHALAWDAARARLWALGGDELRAYRLRERGEEGPALLRVEAHALPDRGGHDLAPVPGSPLMIVTTAASVWRFDRDRRLFERAGPPLDTDDVKSVDVHPLTSRIAWVRAERDHRAARVFLANPEREIALPGEEIYKARWVAR